MKKIFFFFLVLFPSCTGYVAAMNAKHDLLPIYFSTNKGDTLTDDVRWLRGDQYDDYALWRFENVQPCLGDTSLRITFIFPVGPNTLSDISVRVTYTNPKTGAGDTRILSLTVRDNEARGTDIIPLSFLTEQGSLIVRVERVETSPYALGVTKTSLAIINNKTPMEKDTESVYTEGSIMPTAYIAGEKRYLESPNTQQRRIGVTVVGLYLPRHEFLDEKDYSAVFAGLDMRYRCIDEQQNIPACALGIMGAYPVVYRPVFEERGYTTVYAVASKTFQGVLNVNTGIQRGNTIDMFVYPYQANVPQAVNKTMLFGSIIFHATAGSSFAFECGYDVDKTAQISSWVYSVNAFQHRITLDFGVALTNANHNQKRDLFIAVKTKV